MCHLAVRNDYIVDGLGLLLDVFAARPVKCERHWCRLQCPLSKSEQCQLLRRRQRTGYKRSQLR